MANLKVKPSKTVTPKSKTPEVQGQPRAGKESPPVQPDRQPIHITLNIEKVVIQSSLGWNPNSSASCGEAVGAALGGDLAIMSGSTSAKEPSQFDLSNASINREITHWVDSVLLHALALKINQLRDLPTAEEDVEVPRPPRPVRDLAYDLFAYPEEWLKTPNSQLGDRKPIDLLGTEEEFRVQNLLNAVDLGLF